MPVSEKGESFLSQGYNDVPPSDSPWLTEEHGFTQPRHTRMAVSTTKKKSQSTWTKFMLWFRTRLLRIKAEKSSSRQ